MTRRKFITLLGGAAAAWPLAARAQQPEASAAVGFLLGAVPPAQFGLRRLSAGFAEGLRELGYVEDKRFQSSNGAQPKGDMKAPYDLAAELVRLKVDVISSASPSACGPAQQATSTIPIVMGYSVDPVGNGFVASFHAPGGNTYGATGSSDDSSLKAAGVADDDGAQIVSVSAARLTLRTRVLRQSMKMPGRRSKASLSLGASEARNPQRDRCRCLLPWRRNARGPLW